MNATEAKKQTYFHLKLGNATLLGLLLLASAIGVATVYGVSLNRLRDLRIEKESGKLDLLAQNIENFYEPLRRNIEFLADYEPVQQVLVDDTQLPALREAFKLIASAASDYDQIRLLDLAGRERLRINRSGDREAVVESDDNLQDKSKRDYFRAALRLGPGEIYISPLDLNQENGVIERPLKQVIRCVKKIYSPSQQPLGIVVTNYLGQRFLAEEAVSKDQPHSMLLSQKGDFLHGPDFYPKFATLLGTPSPSQFKDFFPDVWDSLVTGSEGNRILTSQGCFQYRTISASPNDGTAREPMFLVSFLPNAELKRSSTSQWLAGFVFPLASVWLLSCMFTYAIVRKDEKQRLAEQQKIIATELSQQAEDLRRSNQELEQFAFVASHDLQEPLRKITTFGSLLKAEHENQFCAESLSYLEIMISSSLRMRALIEDLLEYSRVASPGRELHVVDSQKALEEALDNLSERIEGSDAVITQSMQLPNVLGDSLHLTQLFQNLILNGIKYCKEEPRISIRCSRDSGLWHFRIEDNGIGIGPEYTERIFQVFTRLHTQNEYQGTGIGLAICKRIVERSGGTIWVEPNPSGGSVFHFSLPGAD
jgi:signal transduction histidine kinase